MRTDSASSLSRLMSEIERNQPEEMYNDGRSPNVPANKGKQKVKTIISKNSGGGDTSVDSMMEDTPSNYNNANMRLENNLTGARSRIVKIQEQDDDGVSS